MQTYTYIHLYTYIIVYTYVYLFIYTIIHICKTDANAPVGTYSTDVDQTQQAMLSKNSNHVYS